MKIIILTLNSIVCTFHFLFQIELLIENILFLQIARIIIQAKMLDAMDEEFGISGLIDEEFADTKKTKVFNFCSVLFKSNFFCRIMTRLY